MTAKLTYHRSAERPSAKLWLFDDDGTLIDFSSGYTFSLKIGLPGSAALLTKATNIAGAAGAGTEPDGTPNVVVNWTSGELNLTPGRYSWQLTCTTSGLDRVFAGEFVVLETIT